MGARSSPVRLSLLSPLNTRHMTSKDDAENPRTTYSTTLYLNQKQNQSARLPVDGQFASSGLETFLILSSTREIFGVVFFI